MVTAKKGLNLRKGLILYERSNKSHTFPFWDAFSLEHKEQIDLHKLVFQLCTSAIKGLRLSH
jgi:hypothetical protein